jgi:hypothetical protein
MGGESLAFPSVYPGLAFVAFGTAVAADSAFSGLEIVPLSGQQPKRLQLCRRMAADKIMTTA